MAQPGISIWRRRRGPDRPVRGMLLAFAFALTAAAGCDLPGKPSAADRYQPPQEVLDFSQLFSQNCAGCHGADGKLGPAPPLNDPLFLAIVPQQVLDTILIQGRPGTAMPAFHQSNGGPLTTEQVKVLSEGLVKKWGPRDQDWNPPPPTYTQPPSTEPAGDQLQSGKRLFTDACATCHGDEGKGHATNAGRELAINVPAFLALISDQALRRYIITGRPDLGMPDYADQKGRARDFKPLTTKEVDDLMVYVRSWRTAR